MNSRCLLIILVSVLFGKHAASQECSENSIKKNVKRANELRFEQASRSEEIALKSLSCSRKLDFTDGIIRSLNILGFHNLLSGRKENAFIYFQESLTLSEEVKDSVLIAIANNNLGNYYNAAGLDEFALDYYLTSLRIKRIINDSKGIDVALVNIGIIYDKQGKHQQALDHYRQALKMKQANKDIFGIARCYENMGIAYAGDKQFREAMKYLHQAKEIYQGESIESSVISVQLSMVLVYLELNDLSKARSELKLIEQSIHGTTDVATLNLYFDLQTKLHLEYGQFDRARAYADSSLYYALQTQDISAEVASYERLAELHEAMGNELNSVLNTNKALQLKDSLNRMNNRVALEEMQLRYETSELSNKIRLQKKDIELLNLSNTTRAYFIFLIILISLLLLGGIYWKYQRSQKLKDSLKSELNMRNKELLSFTVQTAKKNEVIQRLKELMSTDEGEPEQHFSNEKKIHSLLKEVERTEDDWHEFRMRFEKIQPNFFKKLSANYKLTETDLRICALIKLSVTTQEAANMLNITAESVNKARYRLRKKLELPKDVELNSFIRNFP